MTEQPTENASRNRVAVYALAGLAALVVVALVVAYFSRTPQMGPDDDVFRTVDALYTAVRMKDSARVADCEKRLNEYRQGGKLPKGAADSLNRIIAKTRDGRWESATESLYEFMLAQRREGTHEPDHANKHRPAKR
jgi:hypothetical protein